MAIKGDVTFGADEFQRLVKLVAENFGIIIKGDKRLTIHTKLSHRLRILGMQSYTQYLDFAENDRTGEELTKLASHITNNETYFFREKEQLDLFTDLLADIKREKVKAGRNDLSVLSVACSSGEEAYTLNIIVLESGLFVWDWDIKVAGMDINSNLIERAERGVYSRHSFRNINGDDKLLKRYFYIKDDRYILKRVFAKNVSFKQANVIEREPYEEFGKADVIFCRNVLIYMNDDAFGRVIDNCYNTLNDTGYMFLGASESLIQRTGLFVPEYNNGVIVYRKNIKG